MTPRAFLRTASAALTIALVAAACSSAPSPNEVTVGGLDYAFEVPDTLPAGPTVFHFENRGEVRHEMILVRLREGVTMEDVMEGIRTGADPGDFVEGGLAILLADPGETAVSQLYADLLPGRTYALICNLQDSPEDPPHTALGMRASFRVEGGAG